ncbi:PPOX class F420-dependent oxidoreductase [Nocardia asteroides]|uniref:PPOX class F420-dependent oxidoreductase n=1 Tax=Nocardia asteroides TaxID=1824 RepID=UPI001E3D0C87|nr:PPOX class F420-dependent oxidoreductase [Nocardia asteroides]UGT62923.1 PPOX class F420-dependent oxidoreductase [Nocardia asteroides]
MSTSFGAVATANYVLLTTFRKDGTPVATPVWAVSEGDTLYVWTETNAGKVKRIRRDGTVTLQPCSARGKPTGDVIEHGSARVLDAAGTEKVRSLLRRKYWLTAPLLILGSNIRRGKDGTVGLAITPAAAPA